MWGVNLKSSAPFILIQRNIQAPVHMAGMVKQILGNKYVYAATFVSLMSMCTLPNNATAGG